MKTTSKVLLAPDCIVNWKTSPHMLVSGVTGSAKTNTLEDVLLSTMSTKSRLNVQELGMCAKAYIIDGKGSDLASLTPLHPAVTPNQAARTLRVLTQNMHKRYEHFSGEFGKTADDYDINGKHVRDVVLIIDELVVLLNDPKLRSEILRYLFDLLVAARQASIYVSPFGAMCSCWNSATVSGYPIKGCNIAV
jgi:DNA segregation ATPase FtsK/SpoIIIE-like protein